MDYTLAALKLFCGQLKYARPTSSPSAMTLGGVLFQRAWLQGVLVSGQDEGCYILDDGTDVIELQLTNEFQQEQWKTGMYVMVIGLYVARPEELPVIKENKQSSWTFTSHDVIHAWEHFPCSCEHPVSMHDLKTWKSCCPICVQVHKIVDLSPQPDREAMWHLEVIEAYKLFYQPSVDE